jgi:TPR repeat protein
MTPAARPPAPALAALAACLLLAFAPAAPAQDGGAQVTPSFVKDLEAKADGGDVASLHALGLLFYYGEGVRQDYKKSAGYLSSAAEAGFPPSLSFLGLLYERGLGVKEDIPKAVELYERAADAGDSLAQLSLGALYFFGEKLPADYDKALAWFGKAAANGDFQANLFLGQMYVQGKGVAPDVAKALGFFKKAADSPEDDGHAAYVAAELYRVGGPNLKPNPREARKYYELGAWKGHAGCQEMIAQLDKK